MFCFVLLAWFCGFLRALYCIIWILVEFPLYPAQHIPASQDWLQGKTQVNDNVFGLVSTAHSSTKPGIIRAMAWVSYSHENGVGWVQSTWFFFLCAWKPYRLEVPGAPRVDECVFQYLTQCLPAAAADHAGDDAKVVSSWVNNVEMKPHWLVVSLHVCVSYNTTHARCAIVR